MNVNQVAAAGATFVVWMVAAGDQDWSDNFIRRAIDRCNFPPGLLTTWPLLERHPSGATVGVWLLVAAAQAEADAKEFVAARAAMEPECALELAYTWPGKPGTRFPAAYGYNADHGWLTVFPSPLMQKTEEAPAQH